MSRAVKTPVNQILHTNVAIVKMKIQKAVFEIACYKNSVVSWRKGIEKDLSEVVQIDTVFTNVSKGEAAKKTDLQKYFGTSDTKEVCKKILQDGELQVSTKEREEMYESMFKDIVTIITNKCINPETQRPYPGGVIERALKEQIHFSVKPSKSTKQQALEAISKLKKKIPIEKAHMRLKLTLSGKNYVKQLKQLLKNANKEEEQVKFEQDDYSPESETANIICRIDPGLYREIFDLIDDQDGEVQVLDTTVSEEGDTTIDELGDQLEQFEKKSSQSHHHSDNDDEDNEQEEEQTSTNKKKKSTTTSTTTNEEQTSSNKKKSSNKKSKKTNKNHQESDEEKPTIVSNKESGDDEEQLNPKKQSNKKDKKKKDKKKQAHQDSDNDDEAQIEEEEPKKTNKKAAVTSSSNKKKTTTNNSSDNEEAASHHHNNEDSDNEELATTQSSSSKKQSKKEKKKAKKFSKQTTAAASSTTQDEDEEDE